MNDQNQSKFRQDPPGTGDQNQSRNTSNWNANAAPWLKKPGESQFPVTQNQSGNPSAPEHQNQSAQNQNPAQPESQQEIPTIALDFGSEMKKMISTAGTLKLTPEQERILFEPVNDYHIKMKEDGTIYLPWTWYHDRLTRAFGYMQWSLVPQGMPKLLPGDLIMWGWHLVAQGVYMGFAIGEKTYIPSNARMSYGEACEGAKSNALMRLCKGMGISLELWDKDFCKYWEEKYSITYVESRTNKTRWKLRDGVSSIFQDLIRKEKEQLKSGISSSGTPEAPVVIIPADQTQPHNSPHQSKPAVPPNTKRGPGKRKAAAVVNELPLEVESKKINTEVTGVSEKLQPYMKKIQACENVGAVKKVMDGIKLDFTTGGLTEDEKQQLTQIANKHSVQLTKKK